MPELSPLKQYKIFLVEVDDEDRERVLHLRGQDMKLDITPEYVDLLVDDQIFSAAVYKTSESATLTINLLPMENGAWLRIEDFTEEEEDPYA